MLGSRWSCLSSACRPSNTITCVPFTARPLHTSITLYQTDVTNGHGHDGSKSSQPAASISSLYIDTLPPTDSQSKAAKHFFQTHHPSKSWTAAEWRNQPHSPSTGGSTTPSPPLLTPEIAFLGRSNSGKSSLLNALLLQPTLCRVGPKPGKTTTMHAWSLTPIVPDTPTKRAKRIHNMNNDTEPKLTLLDMPGYGHGSREAWGADILKYLTSRRQLRRAFVLVQPKHGLLKSDLQLLELLHHHGIPHQMVACKCETVKVAELPGLLERLREDLSRHIGSAGKGKVRIMTIGDILAVGGLGDGKANQNVKSARMVGVEDVRWAVLRAAGLEDYVLALAGGGVPVKTKGESAVLEAQKKQEVEPGDATRISAATTGQPSTETKQAPERIESVALGMDEFMAMLGSSKSKLSDREEQTEQKQAPRTMQARRKATTRTSATSTPPRQMAKRLSK